jgi:hypothetical protein
LLIFTGKYVRDATLFFAWFLINAPKNIIGAGIQR